MSAFFRRLHHVMGSFVDVGTMSRNVMSNCCPFFRYHIRSLLLRAPLTLPGANYEEKWRFLLKMRGIESQTERTGIPKTALHSVQIRVGVYIVY